MTKIAFVNRIYSVELRWWVEDDAILIIDRTFV
jgi:hypothetical protein